MFVLVIDYTKDIREVITQDCEVCDLKSIGPLNTAKSSLYSWTNKIILPRAFVPIIKCIPSSDIWSEKDATDNFTRNQIYKQKFVDRSISFNNENFYTILQMLEQNLHIS